MTTGILIGVGATLLQVFLLWAFYATGVEMERKRSNKEGKQIGKAIHDAEKEGR